MSWRIPSFLSKKAFVIILILLVLIYLFVPLLPLTFLPQERFRADTDIRRALSSVAEVWRVPESGLRVLAVQFSPDKSKSLIIIHPETLSSAKVWIASPQPQPGQPTLGFAFTERLHLSSEYTPHGLLERMIAHNFYTKSKWGTDPYNEAILDIEADLPFGMIRTNSLNMGELQYSTFITYPIVLLAVHVDRLDY